MSFTVENEAQRTWMIHLVICVFVVVLTLGMVSILRYQGSNSFKCPMQKGQWFSRLWSVFSLFENQTQEQHSWYRTLPRNPQDGHLNPCFLKKGV